MLDAFVILVLAAPVALFGRRKGTDRHGEVRRSGAGDGAGDAFAAFADAADGDTGDPAGTTGPDGSPVSVGDDLSAAVVEPLTFPVGSVDGRSEDSGPSGEGVRPVPQADNPDELWHQMPVVNHRDPAPLPAFDDLLAPGHDGGSDAVRSPAGGGGVDAVPFRLNRLRQVAAPAESVEEGYLVSRAGGSAVWEDPVTAARPQHEPGPLTGRPVGRARHRLHLNAGYGYHGAQQAPPDRWDAGRPERPDQAGERTAPEPAAVVAPAPVEETPVAVVDETVPVLVAADGVVGTGSGSVRVAGPDDASASSGTDGLLVHLSARWCWAALDDLSPDVVVRTDVTSLSVPAGTTALLSIDDDGAQLIVVLVGEGVVEHAGGRIRLRSGAMAYLPVDGDPQVDVAPDDEIRTDPLVAMNLELDAAGS